MNIVLPLHWPGNHYRCDLHHVCHQPSLGLNSSDKHGKIKGEKSCRTSFENVTHSEEKHLTYSLSHTHTHNINRLPQARKGRFSKMHHYLKCCCHRANQRAVTVGHSTPLHCFACKWKFTVAGLYRLKLKFYIFAYLWPGSGFDCDIWCNETQISHGSRFMCYMKAPAFARYSKKHVCTCVSCFIRSKILLLEDRIHFY